MSALRDALVQYVALRRALGTQLQEPAVTLVHFLEFLEREGAQFITSELALRWAMERFMRQVHRRDAEPQRKALRKNRSQNRRVQRGQR